MPFAATWMDLEIIIQSEVCPTQKDNTIWYHLYVESKMWYKWTNLWNRSRFANIKNRLVVVKVGGIQFSPVQLLSRIWLFTTPWASAHQASLSITNSWSLFNLMSIESVMPSNHLTLCHPHFLLPSIFLSIRVFSNDSVLHIRWPKYWSFSFSISLSNE